MKLIGTCLSSLLIFFSAISLYSAEQKLIVIRHGEADNNVDKVYNSDPDNADYVVSNLTESGKKTVQKIAKELLSQGFNSSNIAAVYVSPLPRTQQTADILVQMGLVSKSKVFLDPNLIELKAGDLEGKSTFPTWKSSYTSEYSAESEEEVKARVKTFYDSISNKYPKGNVVVITHEIPAHDLIEIVAHQNVKLNPGEYKVIPLK